MFISIKEFIEITRGLPDAEGEVSGVLRGGWIRDNKFYTNNGTGSFYVDIKTVKNIRIFIDEKWKKVVRVNGNKVFTKMNLRLKK